MLNTLESISQIISNNLILAPFLCLVAGFLSALLPCSLSQLPLLITYLGGYEKSNNNFKAIKYSIYYALGNTIVFVALGIFSAIIGKGFSLLNKKVYIFLGILMLAMFLQSIGVIDFIPKKLNKPITTKKGCIGALILGIIGGFFASPCSTPVLLTILSFVISTKNVLLGGIMLLFYSIGNGIILVIIGSSITIAERLTSSEKMSIIGKIINYILAISILFLGLYMLYLGF